MPLNRRTIINVVWTVLVLNWFQSAPAHGQSASVEPGVSPSLAGFDPRLFVQQTAENHPSLRAVGARLKATDQQVLIEAGPYDWMLWSDLQYSRVIRTPTRITDPDDYQRAEGAVGVSRLWNFGLRTSVVVGLTYEHFGLAENSALASLPVRVFSSVENYSPSLALQFEQSLLRGRSPEANEAAQRGALFAADAARLRAEQAASALFAETLLAFIDVAAATEALTLQIEALALAQEQLDKTKLLVERGVLASMETFPLEQAVVARKQQITETQTVQADAWLRLEQAVGGKISRTLPQAPSLRQLETLGIEALPTEQDAESVAQKSAYGPKIADAEWLQKKSLLLRAKDQELPNLVLRASASLDGSSDEIGAALADVFTAENPQIAVGLRLDLPVTNQAAKAARMQIDLEAKATKTDVDVETLRVTYELRKLRLAMASAEEGLILLDETEHWAQQTWLAEKSRLEGGRGTAMLVSQALLQWVEIRLLKVQSHARRWRSAVIYRNLAGSLIADIGVELSTAFP